MSLRPELNHGVVRFDGVWKSFQRRGRPDSLRDLLPAAARALVRRTPRTADDVFWALRDISFEVTPGRIFGIIGPNGAGKSTILKLISGILRPTRGEVRVHGRVGALIEVAAGFHTDLTGRENVFLQGAIMGMARAEVARRFDEIVEFAGVGDFINSPVKHYSSGMTARLGFAVAAHFDPDVLLVDEVLTVGDLAFQRKAFDRLEQLVRRQIPIVLVSHQLDRVLKLCGEALLLVHGQAVAQGPPAECIAVYIEGQPRNGSGDGQPSAPVQLHDLSLSAGGAICSGDEVRLRLRGMVVHPNGGNDTRVGVRLRALPSEEVVFTTNHTVCGTVLPNEGPFELEIALQLNVGPGVYRAQGAVWRRDGSEWARGPGVLVTVDKQANAYGAVYMHPRMRLVTP